MNRDKPIISVIIPVFNTKRYLSRCINSILNQKFKDFEIILVDDGSTDGSIDICYEYEGYDKKIRVIKSSHLGVSGARNTGLDNARGKYIMFCDSDDYVEPDWIYELYDAAVRFPSSLCNCEYAVAVPSENKSDVQLLPGLTKSQIIEKRYFFLLLYYSQIMHLWTRIFRTDIIRENNIRFKEVSTEGEDMMFIADYIDFCENFYFIHKCLYNWCYNNEVSLSTSFHPYYFQDMKNIYIARTKHISDEYIQDHYDYSFIRFMKCLDFIWDERNKDSMSEKYRQSQVMFSDPVFQETVKHVSSKVCSHEKRLLILSGNYMTYHRIYAREDNDT